MVARIWGWVVFRCVTVVCAGFAVVTMEIRGLAGAVARINVTVCLGNHGTLIFIEIGDACNVRHDAMASIFAWLLRETVVGQLTPNVNTSLIVVPPCA